jgi:hypothetical protein
MSANPDPDIIIGRLPTGLPLVAELERRDLAVAGVLGLIARGRSLGQAARSLRIDGQAVCLDDVLVAIGAFPDRPPTLNGQSVRFVDEAWTSPSGHRCRLRRPPHPGRGHR